MLEIRSPMRSARRWIGTALAVLTTAALAQAQTPTPSAASAPAAKPAIHGSNRTAAARQLDLHTPPLNHIYPSSELRYIMAVEEPNADDTTEVSVKGTKYGVQVPGVPGNQLQAIPWAIMHPTQAWRIFTPLESP
jgi:hypothetical protein